MDEPAYKLATVFRGRLVDSGRGAGPRNDGGVSRLQRRLQSHRALRGDLKGLPDGGGFSRFQSSIVRLQDAKQIAGTPVHREKACRFGRRGSERGRVRTRCPASLNR